jgi:hypothetical protein
MPNTDPLLEFRRRIREVWLPAFRNDPKRQYSAEGFRESSVTISPGHGEEIKA